MLPIKRRCIYLTFHHGPQPQAMESSLEDQAKNSMTEHDMIQNQDRTRFLSLLERALEPRQPLFDVDHQAAFRLFNGFTEGFPELVIDLYGATILIHNYAENVADGLPFVQDAQQFLLSHYP